MLTPQEVSSHAFTKGLMGGYNMAMVDEFLDELTDDYTALYKENSGAESQDERFWWKRWRTTGPRRTLCAPLF